MRDWTAKRWPLVADFAPAVLLFRRVLVPLLAPMLSPVHRRFIEGGYNPHRRHSAIGHISPVDYEWKYAESVLESKSKPVH